VAAGRRRRRATLTLLVLGVIAAAGWQYRISRPAYRLSRGHEAVRARDWDAVAEYARRLESAGRADEAHLLRGEALQAQKRPDLALRELNQIQSDGPLRVQTAAISGRCLLDLGELREAHLSLSFVIAEQPDHVDAYRGLAAIDYDLGRLGQAVDHLERVAELDAADARPHRLIGLIYKDMAQHALAVTAYHEALRRGLPESMEREVRLELAEVLVQQGQFAEGLKVLDEGGPIDEAEPTRAVARAECLRGLGRRVEAADVLDIALGKAQTASLYRLRGQIHMDDGHTAEAISQFDRAVEKSPSDHQARFLLAQAYAVVGRKDDAKREFAHVEEIRKDLDRITSLSRQAMDKPWDPGVRLELAEVCDRLGKSRLADMWRKAAAACASRKP